MRGIALINAVGIDIVLKCDLLRGMFEGQCRKPSLVSHSPGRPRLVLASVTQKSLKILARSRHHLAYDAAQPDQVAHGFMIGVGHPDGRQLTGLIEAGEHGGIAAVRLHPIAGLSRDQRRCHHVAPMAEARELAMNAITARVGPIAKRQRLTGTPETVAQLANGASLAISPKYSTDPERPLSATATDIRCL
ncbi:hypothetical protein [Mesorhizobium neociceri]|uniref:Uncharacterized protein n=1 Tax=Mesorhizobium neociceri TaxID=1307853 RepID=A0A838B9X9_9HYPH|nr:hypothetical protein [Mesorhizobium neociceri]MBA1142474.1 hypothetical protein [Mesorhizobium neociceri]